MENQERKKIELKPVPLKSDTKLTSVQVQTKPPTKRDILEEDEISQGFSKPEQKDKQKQSVTGKEDQPQGRRNKRNLNKISRFPSFEFELDEETINKLNQTPKEFRSVETMIVVMEAQVKGLDGFMKQNPIMIKVINQFVEKVKGRFEVIKKQRIEQETAQAIEYQRPDRDHYQMRKNQTIHGLIREVEVKWAKKIEIETKGFTNRTYQQYLELLKQKVAKEVETVNFEAKKQAIQNVTKQICEPNRLKYNEMKTYDESKLQLLSVIAKKLLNSKIHMKRIQGKLKNYMDLKQVEEFGGKVEYSLWTPADYFIQFA